MMRPLSDMSYDMKGINVERPKGLSFVLPCDRVGYFI